MVAWLVPRSVTNLVDIEGNSHVYANSRRILHICNQYSHVVRRRIAVERLGEADGEVSRGWWVGHPITEVQQAYDS